MQQIALQQRHLVNRNASVFPGVTATGYCSCVFLTFTVHTKTLLL